MNGYIRKLQVQSQVRVIISGCYSRLPLFFVNFPGCNFTDAIFIFNSEISLRFFKVVISGWYFYFYFFNVISDV